MFGISLPTLAVCLLILWIVWCLTYRRRKLLYMQWFSGIVDDFNTNVYQPHMGGLKKELFEGLHQAARTSVTPLKVIEIGSGTGANFKYFPDGLDLTCFEPKPTFEPYVRKNADLYLTRSKLRIVNERFGDVAQFADNSIDAVLCTLVLCSVKDQAKVLATTRRVLKPVSMWLTQPTYLFYDVNILTLLI